MVNYQIKKRPQIEDHQLKLKLNDPNEKYNVIHPSLVTIGADLYLLQKAEGCKDNMIPVHREFIMTVIPYFAKQYSDDGIWREGKLKDHGDINISQLPESVNITAVVAYIKSLYEVDYNPFSLVNCLDILELADYWCDQFMKTECLNFIEEAMDDKLFDKIYENPRIQSSVGNIVKEYVKALHFVGSLDLTGVNTVLQNIRIVDTDGTFDYQGKPQYKNKKREELKQICTKMFDKSKDKMIIFVATKRGADDLCHLLNMKMVHDLRTPIAEAIHGDRSQKERDTLGRFREGKIKIMVATDVASRGIDLQDVTFVVNYYFPDHVEEYVHRIGRTGRAGQKGTVISFFTGDNQTSAKELIKILKKTPGTVIPSGLVQIASKTESNQYHKDRSQNYQNASNPYDNAGFKNLIYQNQSYGHGHHQTSSYNTLKYEATFMK